MIYKCKACGAEISLSELDLEAASFCLCGGQEMTFLRTGRSNFKSPVNTDSQKKLQMILEGIKAHYRAA